LKMFSDYMFDQNHKQQKGEQNETNAASKFSPKNPRQLVYDEDGVKIYALPVVHCIDGSLGYRLEWKGLVFAYTSDSEPSTFEAEQSKGADVFIHEVLPSPEGFALHTKMPLEHAENSL